MNIWAIRAVIATAVVAAGKAAQFVWEKYTLRGQAHRMYRQRKRAYRRARRAEKLGDTFAAAHETAEMERMAWDASYDLALQRYHAAKAAKLEKRSQRKVEKAQVEAAPKVQSKPAAKKTATKKPAAKKPAAKKPAVKRAAKSTAQGTRRGGTTTRSSSKRAA